MLTTVSKVCILLCALQINHTPYLSEVFLYAPVIEEESSAQVGSGVVEIKKR